MCYTNCLNLEELKKYGQVIINHYCNCCCKGGETDPVNPPEKPTQPTDPVEPIEEDVKWSAENSTKGITITNDGLQAVVPSNKYAVLASKPLTSGKWYWEIECSNGQTAIGVGTLVMRDTGFVNTEKTARLYYGVTGIKSPGAKPYGEAFSSGRMGIALDLDLGTIEFFKNGKSQGVAFTDLKTLDKLYPLVTCGTDGKANLKAIACFKRSSFKYPIPEGFKPYAEV